MADEKNKKTAQQEPKEPKTPPAPPVPCSLDVDYSGQDGNYTFYIQVTTAQGIGVQARILIVEGEGGAKPKPTDEKGYLEHSGIAFTEEERDFLFRVHGTNLEREFTLPGPKQPPEPPRERIKTITGGFLANFRNARQKNQERK